MLWTTYNRKSDKGGRISERGRLSERKVLTIKIHHLKMIWMSLSRNRIYNNIKERMRIIDMANSGVENLNSTAITTEKERMNLGITYYTWNGRISMVNSIL